MAEGRVDFRLLVKELAKELQVAVGDKVTVTLAEGVVTPAGVEGSSTSPTEVSGPDGPGGSGFVVDIDDGTTHQVTVTTGKHEVPLRWQ